LFGRRGFQIKRPKGRGPTKMKRREVHIKGKGMKRVPWGGPKGGKENTGVDIKDCCKRCRPKSEVRGNAGKGKGGKNRCHL